MRANKIIDTVEMGSASITLWIPSMDLDMKPDFYSADTLLIPTSYPDILIRISDERVLFRYMHCDLPAMYNYSKLTEKFISWIQPTSITTKTYAIETVNNDVDATFDVSLNGTVDTDKVLNEFKKLKLRKYKSDCYGEERAKCIPSLYKFISSLNAYHK